MYTKGFVRNLGESVVSFLIVRRDGAGVAEPKPTRLMTVVCDGDQSEQAHTREVPEYKGDRSALGCIAEVGACDSTVDAGEPTRGCLSRKAQVGLLWARWKAT